MIKLRKIPPKKKDSLEQLLAAMGKYFSRVLKWFIVNFCCWPWHFHLLTQHVWRIINPIQCFLRFLNFKITWANTERRIRKTSRFRIYKFGKILIWVVLSFCFFWFSNIIIQELWCGWTAFHRHELLQPNLIKISQINDCWTLKETNACVFTK